MTAIQQAFAPSILPRDVRHLVQTEQVEKRHPVLPHGAWDSHVHVVDEVRSGLQHVVRTTDAPRRYSRFTRNTRIDQKRRTSLTCSNSSTLWASRMSASSLSQSTIPTTRRFSVRSGACKAKVVASSASMRRLLPIPSSTRCTLSAFEGCASTCERAENGSTQVSIARSS